MQWPYKSAGIPAMLLFEVKILFIFLTISSVHRVLTHGAGHEMLIDDVQVIIEK
jgi:hypothetical protein